MNINEGDLFQLGNHKLLCGDSTQPETYKKLIGTQKIDLIITDPPYNVNYATKQKHLQQIGKCDRICDDIINDNIQDFPKFMESVLKCWKPFMNDYNSIYIYIQPITLHHLINIMIKEGYNYTTFLTWVKPRMVFGFMDYKKRTEQIIYGWYKKHKFYGPPTNTDVLEYNKPQKNKLHPTMKPLKLIAKLVTNSSKPRMNVLDCFGGSGTTLLVCEKLNRNCYMIEKDPHYIEIIIRRWENLTKQKAIKI
jgi:site-specific DNA-methyltransferase (adenine-specific)